MIRGELVFTERELEKIIECHLNSTMHGERIRVYHIRPCGTEANPNSEYLIGIQPMDQDAD